MKNIKELVSEHPFFKALDEKYLELVAGCGTNVVYKEGEFIFKEDESADSFYIVREGKIAIQMFANDKGEIVVETVSGGDVLGWSWLFPPYLWHFDARVITVARLIRFDGKCLRKKCEEDHNLGYEFLKRFVQLITKRLENTRLQLLNLYESRGNSSTRKV